MGRIKKLGKEIVLVSRSSIYQKRCRQCLSRYEGGWRRPAIDFCGHVKCLECIAHSKLRDCKQCKWFPRTITSGGTGGNDSEENKGKTRNLAAGKQELSDADIDDAGKVAPRHNFRTQLPVNVMMWLDSQEIPYYQCEVCRKPFRTRRHAQYHRFCGMSGESKPFQCHECGQGFMTKGHFNYHRKTNTAHHSNRRVN